MTVSELRQVIAGLRFRANQEKENKPESKPALNMHARITAFADILEEKLNKNSEYTVADNQDVLKCAGELRKMLSEAKRLVDVQRDLGEEDSPVGIGASFVKNVEKDVKSIENVLADIDMTRNMPLAQCVEDTTLYRNVSLPDGVIPDSVGGLSSKRYMIKVKNAQGQDIEGFFTPDSKLFDYDSQGKYRREISLFREKNADDPVVTAFCDRVLSGNNVDNLLMSMRNRPVYDDTYKIKFLNSAYNFDKMRAFKLADGNNMSFERINRNAKLKNFLLELRHGVSEDRVNEMSTALVQYNAIAKTSIAADYGSSIEGRSIATSRVNNLLGNPTGCVRSVPMTVQFGGKVYRGSFMEKADGIDYPGDENMLKSDFITKIADKSQHPFDGEPLRDVADIQICNYILNNVDCHQNNMLYKFDENGKLVKVQEIDPTLSFGNRVIPPEREIQNAPPLYCINVISERMAESIRNLHVDTLRTSMEEQGLTKREIESACKRFLTLREHLEKNSITRGLQYGKIRIVKDGDWKKMKAERLYSVPPRGVQGTYTLFYAIVNVADKTERAQELAKLQPVQVERSSKSFKEAAAVDELSAERLAQRKADIQAYLDRLNNNSEWNRDKSEQCTRAKAALKTISEWNLSEGLSASEKIRYNSDLRELDFAVSSAAEFLMEAGAERGSESTRKYNIVAELSDYVASYYEDFHSTYIASEERSLEEIYKEYAEERKNTAGKQEAIYNALTDIISEKHQGTPKDKIAAFLEKDMAFSNLLQSDDFLFSNLYMMSLDNPEELYARYLQEVKNITNPELQEREPEAEYREIVGDDLLEENRLRQAFSAKTGMAPGNSPEEKFRYLCSFNIFKENQNLSREALAEKISQFERGREYTGVIEAFERIPNELINDELIRKLGTVPEVRKRIAEGFRDVNMPAPVSPVDFVLTDDKSSSYFGSTGNGAILEGEGENKYAKFAGFADNFRDAADAMNNIRLTVPESLGEAGVRVAVLGNYLKSENLQDAYLFMSNTDDPKRFTEGHLGDTTGMNEKEKTMALGKDSFDSYLGDNFLRPGDLRPKDQGIALAARKARTAADEELKRYEAGDTSEVAQSIYKTFSTLTNYAFNKSIGSDKTANLARYASVAYDTLKLPELRKHVSIKPEEEIKIKYLKSQLDRLMLKQSLSIRAKHAYVKALSAGAGSPSEHKEYSELCKEGFALKAVNDMLGRASTVKATNIMTGERKLHKIEENFIKYPDIVVQAVKEHIEKTDVYRNFFREGLEKSEPGKLTSSILSLGPEIPELTGDDLNAGMEKALESRNIHLENWLEALDTNADFRKEDRSGLKKALVELKTYKDRVKSGEESADMKTLLEKLKAVNNIAEKYRRESDLGSDIYFGVHSLQHSADEYLKKAPEYEAFMSRMEELKSVKEYQNELQESTKYEQYKLATAASQDRNRVDREKMLNLVSRSVATMMANRSIEKTLEKNGLSMDGNTIRQFTNPEILNKAVDELMKKDSFKEAIRDITNDDLKELASSEEAIDKYVGIVSGAMKSKSAEAKNAKENAVNGVIPG